jgi:two-component system KDP operon response regulator KdpE
MPTEPLVLAVDDEPGILRLIRLELTSQAFRVITAEGGREGVRMDEEHDPDIVLLDIMMPDMDGLDVMRCLRERRDVPIILLTARGADADKVRGLELGADDYLAKPFSPDELSARVRAVLRRSAAVADAGRQIQFGSLTIDLHRRLVLRDGDIVVLTRTEWMLLQHLAANPGRVILNAELLSKVWGPEYRSDLQYLRVWISRLRKKIEPDPSSPAIIKTFQGAGYMLEVPGLLDAAPAIEPAPAAAPDLVAR